ncbi:uncharacterized protein LOC116341147 [Contarinia nasturtii]|uniref:uncharacterized protein LOC116341147 n=1 Tax=Contarinia nasturtii TaxID=265458 RepID=UPI0012D39E61|nr:uncharacterized protein LOC116341147 [Contarinia nasturtii]
MKLTTILLLTASIFCSSLAYPAGGNPDNDVELISGGSQPGYQPTPSIPSVPSVPSVPLVPNIPTTFAVPLYPSYPYPSYPTYTPSYFPLGWTYNVFDGFSNIFHQIRNTASNAWSRVPSMQPIIKNYWPDVKTNGSTTSTVKVVGDHKFIINETVHVQQSDFGHIIFKVRTVDIKPAEPNDETTEGVVDNDTTIYPNVDIDTTYRPTEIEEDDERPNVEDTGDIDGNSVGTPELLDNTNEILTLNNLEHFEPEEAPDSAEDTNDIRKQSLTVRKSENIEFDLPSEMIISSEESNDKMSHLNIDQKGVSNEWAEVELDNSDEQKKNLLPDK